MASTLSATSTLTALRKISSGPSGTRPENHKEPRGVGTATPTGGPTATVAIVNPAAGQGCALQKWRRLMSGLHKETRGFETWYTLGHGHAEALAALARRQGFERVIVGGGDGTLFEVVNGLWWEKEGELPSVGIVPLGTACDYVHSFGAARKPSEGLAAAVRNPTVEVGVGEAALRGLDGKPLKRVFLNVLGAGYDANVAARLARNGKLGKVSFLVESLKELFRYKAYLFKGELDADFFEDRSFIFVAGLGRYFGGGMMIAPKASPLAQSFQVLWTNGVGHLKILSLLAKVYRGSHPGDPSVRSRHARRLRIEADPPAYVEADGELLGLTPMEVQLHPAGLRFVV